MQPFSLCRHKRLIKGHKASVKAGIGLLEITVWGRLQLRKGRLDRKEKRGSRRCCAHLNALSRLEFISREHFFWKNLLRISFPDGFNWMLYIHFASLQTLHTLSDIPPWLSPGPGWVGGWGACLPALVGEDSPGPVLSPHACPAPPWGGGSPSQTSLRKPPLQALCPVLPLRWLVVFYCHPFLSCLYARHLFFQLFPTCVTDICWRNYPYGIITMFTKISQMQTSQLAQDFRNPTSNARKQRKWRVPQ